MLFCASWVFFGGDESQLCFFFYFHSQKNRLYFLPISISCCTDISREEVGRLTLLCLLQDHEPERPVSAVPDHNPRADWHWDLSSEKASVPESRLKFTFFFSPPFTHPRLECRVWRHRRRPGPADWSPPPRSHRAWRGAGPEWCCKSTAARGCNPRTPSPYRTIWEENRKYWTPLCITCTIFISHWCFIRSLFTVYHLTASVGQHCKDSVGFYTNLSILKNGWLDQNSTTHPLATNDVICS